MKARLAKKIMKQLGLYVNWDTNYMPYAKGQTEQAIRRQKLAKEVRENLVSYYCKGW